MNEDFRMRTRLGGGFLGFYEVFITFFSFCSLFGGGGGGGCVFDVISC